jgi:hypothetical protein
VSREFPEDAPRYSRSDESPFRIRCQLRPLKLYRAPLSFVCICCIDQSPMHTTTLFLSSWAVPSCSIERSECIPCHNIESVLAGLFITPFQTLRPALHSSPPKRLNLLQSSELISPQSSIIIHIRQQCLVDSPKGSHYSTCLHQNFVFRALRPRIFLINHSQASSILFKSHPYRRLMTASCQRKSPLRSTQWRYLSLRTHGSLPIGGFPKEILQCLLGRDAM